MPTDVTCGDFLLLEPIGQGAMAEVWRGRHAERGFEAAIKIVAKAHLRQPADRKRFQREVASQARLHHPGIVTVFDTGETDEKTADTSGGEIAAGRSFLAMELADGGTLQRHIPASSAADLYTILDQLLDALAHAHAREVIHRDLKPENILLFDTPDGDGRLKLTDFGLAHAGSEMYRRGTAQVPLPTGGTPAFMAPEQFRGQWRRFGPWTDLYSLGLIAYELACGHPPYRDKSVMELAAAHANPTPPEFEPVIELPDTFGTWLEQMLDARPGRRFRSAADARTALSSLPAFRNTQPLSTSSDETSDTAGDVAHSSTDEPPETRTQMPPTQLLSEIEGVTELDPAPPARPDARPTVDSTLPAAPPPDCSAAAAARRYVGFRLFGLAEPDFVGRRDARRRIWEAATEVYQRGRSITLTIDGQTGVGKTRLARWLLRCLHRSGVFRTSEVICQPDTTPVDAIRQLLERRLRTWNLDRSRLHEHLESALPLHLGIPTDQQGPTRTFANGITELLRPTGTTDEPKGPRYHFASDQQKLRLFGRLLEAAARQRPLAVLLDEGLDAAALRRWIGEWTDDSRLPVLWVMTGSERWVDEGDSGPTTALLDGEAARRISLAPLERQAHRSMIESLLEVDDDLHQKVYHRTGGNPLLSVQLLREWLQANRLTRTDRGVVLGQSLTDESAAQLTDLWRRRLGELIGDLPDEAARDARPALEVAAAFGRDVPLADWLELLDRLDVSASEDLIRGLVARGLADWGRTEWRFTHRTLVDVLREQSRQGARWPTIQAAMADWLEQRTDRESKTTYLRLANHRSEAQQPQEAAAAMLQACRLAARQHDRTVLGDLLDRHEEHLKRLPARPALRHRLRNASHRITLDLLSGDGQQALARFFEGERSARRAGLDAELGRLLIAGARAMRHVGRNDDARSCLEEARELFAELGDDRGLAEALMEHGLTLAYLGRTARAARDLERAAALFLNTGHPVRALKANRWRATVFTFEQSFDRAEALADQCLERARELGARMLEARSQNALGEVARFRGRWETAEQHYREAISIWNQYGEASPIYRFNLCLTEIGAGRYHAARQRLPTVEEKLENRGFDHSTLKYTLARLALHAGLGHWQRWEELLAESRRQIAAFIDGEVGDLDEPWLAELAADITRRHDPDRAEKFAGLAADLWEWFGDPERARRLRKKLS